MAASPTRPTADTAAGAIASSPGYVIAVAVSGGRDSIALLHCAARAAQGLGARVHALHVHHGLQPDADRWQDLLAARCRRWARAGLPITLHVRRLEGAPAAAESIEAWARTGRYQALATMARAAGCDAVLLAHHREDQAETVLLQLLRGGGARGLAAMPMVTGRDGIRWLRPWLSQPRRAIEAYLARHRLRWVDDPSNGDARFARSRLRTQVWPALVAAFPDAAPALAAAASRAADDAAALQALADIDASTCVDASGALGVAPWLALPWARRANVLRHLLRQWLGRGAPYSLVDRLAGELCSVRSATWPAPGGAVRLYRGALSWQPEADEAPAAPPPPLVLDLRRTGRCPLPAWGGTLCMRAAKDGGLGLDRLAHVSVTSRLPGDRFQSRPAGPPRALKKQFQTAAVPAWQRHGPVLRDVDGQPIFVAGLGIDARARAPAGTPQRILTWLPGIDR